MQTRGVRQHIYRSGPTLFALLLVLLLPLATAFAPAFAEAPQVAVHNPQDGYSLTGQ